MRTRSTPALVSCFAVAAFLLASGSAAANFPGTNGKIGFALDPAPPGGITQIAAIQPDGQGLVGLTDPATGNDYDPSYSADGERIAFIHVPQPSNSGQVWTMNADGSNQTQLTAGTATERDFGPQYSPDGQWIAFDRYDGTVTTQVWIMRADGSDQTQLTFTADSSRSPSFSPDGSKIVFSRYSPVRMADEIWVMNPDGSNQERLTTGSSMASDGRPSFSPGGTRIVFERYIGAGDSNIWTMNAADGSGLTPVTTSTQLEASATFAPDGTKIAFLRQGPGDDLYTVDLDGNNAAPVPSTAEAYGQASITWQPLNPPSCELSGEPKQKSLRQVTLTLTCANENAAATVEGIGKAPKPGKAAIVSKAKQFTIPAVSVQVPAGAPTSITLPIPKPGRKALKKASKAGKKSKATITATLTDDLGQSSNATFDVKFKAKKK